MAPGLFATPLDQVIEEAPPPLSDVKKTKKRRINFGAFRCRRGNAAEQEGINEDEVIDSALAVAEVEDQVDPDYMSDGFGKVKAWLLAVMQQARAKFHPGVQLTVDETMI